MEEKRNLSDEDIKALAEEFENRLCKRFYLNLGKGFWSIVWRTVVFGMLVIVLIGSYKGDHLF